jgi:serine/threonine-protein kinase
MNEQGRPMRMLVPLLYEMGKPNDAARAATEFLDRSPSWTVWTQGEDYAVNEDPRPVAVASAHRGALIVWAEEWRQHIPAFYVPYIWVAGYARTASTRDEANAALDALVGFGGAPPVFLPRSQGDAWIGHTYVLADRAAEALPYLERAVRQCALLWPIDQTRALHDLGVAHAATGHKDQACASFARVIGRWGAAKPRSITAESARARSRTLGCP